MTLGVLGGTFDPIHLGHVAAAEAAQRALDLQSIILVPSRIPPHRAEPVTASAADRFAMAELACEGRPGWSASWIEIQRDGPSYTYDTLLELSQGPALSEPGGSRSSELGQGPALSKPVGSRSDPMDASKGTQIFFITGADAFAEIATWSRYPAVLDLAHFVVVSRPGITLDSLRERVPSAFEHHPPCSPSALRDLGSEKTRVILVEADTPAVSSTDIRRRVRAGDSLTGMVPTAVADYIHAQHLYLGR
jgi:nicotinate-nucleotide adenylyltransferase